MPAEHQFALAAKMLSTALHHAGLDEHPDVRAAADQSEGWTRPHFGVELEVLLADLVRRSDDVYRRERAAGDDRSLENSYCAQQTGALSAVREAFHDDPLSSVLTGASGAVYALANGVTDRNDSRLEETVRVLHETALSPPAAWDAVLAQFLPALTDGDRATAIARDLHRRDRGEFEQ